MARHECLVRMGLALAAAGLAAGALTSCTSSGADDGDKAGAKKSGPSVVAPGKPGEDAKTLSPEEAAKARPDNKPNAADVAYVQNMIAHHQQALVMTGLAEKHAKAKGVRGMADRIGDTQRPEIGAMEGWLKTNKKPRTPEGGHDHAAMPGMATKAQLDALRKARGTAFDKLFLKLMTTHHQGAITMATDLLTQGNDVLVEEMANDVIATQSSEINRMRDL